MSDSYQNAQEKVNKLLKQVGVLDEELASTLEKGIERLVGVSSTYVGDTEKVLSKLRGQLERERERTQGAYINPETLDLVLPRTDQNQEPEKEEIPFEELTFIERLERNRRNRRVGGLSNYLQPCMEETGMTREQIGQALCRHCRRDCIYSGGL